MGTFDLLPVLDMRSQGWTITGASTLHGAWDNDDDGKYASTPGDRRSAEVWFPVDTSSLPEGAVITAVTVYLRANRTIGMLIDTNVSLVASDDESRYGSRSIYPTTTISTMEMATFTSDPTGQLWDVYRLNHIRARVFTYAPSADAVRVYKVFLRATYHTRPTITIESPTGSVTTPSPSLSWTYYHETGDSEDYSEYRIFAAGEVAEVSFNPDVNSPMYSGKIDGGVTSMVLPESLPPGEYTIYMRTRSLYGAVSTWASRDFEVQGPYPGVPGNDTIQGALGVGTATVVTDSYEGSAHLTIRDASNLLSVQQADFDSAEDQLGYLGTSCTLSRETLNVYTRGLGSMKMTTTTAGTVSATSTFIEVAPNTPYTIRAQVLSAVTARTATLSVQFYTDLFATTGSAVSANTTDSTTTWKEIKATGTTPTDAAYFKLTISYASTALSEVHYVDRVGFMYGTNTAWSSGGHMSRNLLSSYLSTADALGTAGGHFITANSATTVSRVASSGTGSHGSFMYQMTYSGAPTSIAYRATGTDFSSTSSGTGYTLNKPATAVDGDLMVAFVSTGTPSTITVPSGWTLVNYVTTESANGLYILKRTMLTGDPASWTGSFSTASDRRYAVVIAYSGAAPASSQFVADNVRADAAGAAIHKTATVQNTTASAWRLSAFSARNSATGNFTSANKDPATTVPDVLYVGKGTTWSRNTSGTGYTITRPAGVASGDLMLAYVTFLGSGTVTAPAGWTVSYQEVVNVGTIGTFAALKRTAGVSESSSWTGTVSASTGLIITGTEAFRYAKDASLQFGVQGVDYDLSGSGASTFTHTDVINNSSSKAIRVLGYASIAPKDTPAAITSTEVVRRSSEYADVVGGKQITLSFFDSDGPVSTGDHQRVVYTGPAHDLGIAWFALIKSSETIPPAGANENKRMDTTTGSGASWLDVAIFDSNSVSTTGSTEVYATHSSAAESIVSWIGIIKPASPAVEGYAAAKMDSYVDISQIAPEILDRADHKVSIVGSFMGSSLGTPVLSLEFYRANQLLSTVTAEGSLFTTGSWTKSGAVFDLPEGTTKIRPIIAATDRDVADTVSFDRLSVALGESFVWREGTGRAEHPTWSYPQVQYAEDDGTGYGDWSALSGLKSNPPEYDPLTGLVTFVDHTIVPLRPRKYRIQTVSHGMIGDTFVSGYGAETDEAIMTPSKWWMKDIEDSTKNVVLRVDWQNWDVVTEGTSEKFQLIGERYPVVVSDGYKADEFELDIWATMEEAASIQSMVKSGRTLFIQSDVNYAWWVRPHGDIRAENVPTGQRHTNPLRKFKLRFVEVKAEE